MAIRTFIICMNRKSEACGGSQQQSMIVTNAEKAHRQGEQRRAQQRGSCLYANLERREAERREIDGQQHDDEAICEIT